MDLTDAIKIGIQDLVGGTKGVKAGNIYAKFSSLINFAIIYGLSFLINNLLSNFNSILSIIVALLFGWVMTVGPLGHLWGFKTKQTKPKKNEPKIYNLDDVQ